MRVLLHNRDPGGWFGGDATVLTELTTHLRAAGVDAVFDSAPDIPRADFDIVHLHNISMPWTWRMYRQVRAQSLVISTIYEPGVFRLVSRRRQRRMAAAADALICYSDWERRAFVTDLRFEPAHMRTIKIGVNADLATRTAVLSLPHVLHVGRIEPRKNQLTLVRAVRDRPLVLVGDVFDVEYYHRVRAESGRNVLHMSIVSSDMLRGLYGSARVFAFPTRLEVCGLVNLEAGLAGCRVVTSDVGGVREYCGEFPHYVSPDDVSGLRHAVERAWDAPANGFAAFIRDQYSWTRCALEHIGVYEAVLRRRRYNLNARTRDDRRY